MLPSEELYIQQLALLAHQSEGFQAALAEVPAHLKEEVLKQLEEKGILRKDSLEGK